MLSHFNLYMQGRADVEACGVINADGTRLLDQVNILCVLPLSHAYGFSVMALALLVGGTMHLMPDFDIEKILKYIQDHKITAFPGVPTLYAWLAAYPTPKSTIPAQWLAGLPEPRSSLQRFVIPSKNDTTPKYWMLTVSPKLFPALVCRGITGQSR